MKHQTKKPNIMNIVLLEPLGISEELLQHYAKEVEKKGHTFRAYPKDTDPKVQIERAKDADIIMIANMPLSAEVINSCPNLKFIDVAFTGVDHVALDAAKARGIRVSNAAGYSTQAVAELAVCMMISLLRNVEKVSERCREGKTKDGLVGCELGSRKVGIIGTGAIGTLVAALCHAFGCEILGNRRHVTGNEPSYIHFTDIDTILEESDIVTLHCPLTAETRGLLNRERIAKMKKSAILINTARGPVVDSEALAEALNEERIAGAGIDVFECEPPLDTDHPLLHSKNTLVTPHVAFASAESMKARAEIVFDNIWKWMDGNQTNIIL